MNARQRRKMRRAFGRAVGYDPAATMIAYLDWQIAEAAKRRSYNWSWTVERLSRRRDELLRSLSPANMTPEAFKARRSRKATFKYPRWVVPVRP